LTGGRVDGMHLFLATTTARHLSHRSPIRDAIQAHKF
jgi:hypothetical protein